MTETRYTAETAIYGTFSNTHILGARFMFPDGCTGEVIVDRDSDHAIVKLYDAVQTRLDTYYAEEERDALQDALEFPLFCYEQGFHRYGMDYRLYVEGVYQDSEHSDMRTQVRRDLAVCRLAAAV